MEEGEEKDWFLVVRWAHIYSIRLRLALPESAKRKLESTGQRVRRRQAKLCFISFCLHARAKNMSTFFITIGKEDGF
jgi:hypothetical protein